MRYVGRVPVVVWGALAGMAAIIGVAARLGPAGGVLWTGAIWPVAAVGYWVGWVWGFWLVVLVNAIVALLVMGHVASGQALAACSCWALIPAATAWGTLATRRRCAAWDAQGRTVARQTQTLARREQALRHEHGQLEQTMLQLAGLYELTKRLLATLDRLEAARHLSDALTGAFPRTTFRLGFAERRDDSLGLAQMWSLQSDGVHVVEATEPDRWLFTQFCRRPVIWSSDPLIGVAETNQVETPPSLRAATAFPLVMEGTLQGFLVAAGLRPEEVERCGIVVGQFALAVRRIRLYERVQELAIRDGLTGLFVRRHFIARLQEEVARAARQDLPVAFLMIDIDHFKPINDTYGHLVGDTVLRELAALLQTQVREVDFLGRYGGEEFAVALLETDAAQATVVAQRIRQTVNRAVFRAYDERLALTVSIGVAVFPCDAADSSELIERADAAMYRAKAGGRDQICITTHAT